jgi:hypothetical protein
MEQTDGTIPVDEINAWVSVRINKQLEKQAVK